MKVISRKKVDHLIYHVVDAFSSSQEGIISLKRQGLISELEFEELLAKNVKRMQEKLREWRIAEKMVCSVCPSPVTMMIWYAVCAEGSVGRSGSW